MIKLKSSNLIKVISRLLNYVADYIDVGIAHRTLGVPLVKPLTDAFIMQNMLAVTPECHCAFSLDKQLHADVAAGATLDLQLVVEESLDAIPLGQTLLHYLIESLCFVSGHEHF